MTSSDGPYYIGVDVGTSSVRAALVSETGRLISTATNPIKIFEPQPDHYEQSSEDIWMAVCKVIRTVTQGITDKSMIQGIGFDATCSLVLLDTSYRPLSVSSTGDLACNVIMWMDHRASKEVDIINRTQHQVLRNVGGVMSIEAQLPKIMWIKENLYEQSWKKAGHFMDLVDYLTWRATESLQRSMCTVVCKWTYMITEAGKHVGWAESFFQQIGLIELLNEQHFKIGNDIISPGSSCGSGVSDDIASALGVMPGTKVGGGLIDAYAGFLGCIGCNPGDALKSIPLENRAVLISGTSSCYLSMSNSPLFVPGVWGPYHSAVFSDKCINEGGQSITGKLLDHIIETHPAYEWVKSEADKRELHVHKVLNDILAFIVRRDEISHIALLTNQIHLWPDYHGNRSPVADPDLKGMISGLTLGTSAEDLAVLYLATIQALAYGIHHIVDSMTSHGTAMQLLYICGGLSKNDVFVQAHADVLGVPIVVPDCSESVLLGSAILGACASGNYANVEDGMLKMAGAGRIIEPCTQVRRFHNKKYKVFLRMLDHQREYQEIMSS